MYYPPYTPYYQYGPYNLIRGAKRDLRRTSNSLCWTLLIAMFLMSGFTYVCGFYLKAIGYSGDYTNAEFNGFTPILYYLSTGLSYVIGLAVPVLLYFAIRKIPLDEALPFAKAGFGKTLACVLFGTMVCMLANLPANMVVNIEKALGFSGNMPDMPLTDDPWVLVLYGIVIAIIPPIVEELLFRGMILHSLRRFGDGFAIVGSAMLFGLYHANFVQIVFAFIAGLVMALVVVRTGSLWTSIIIHFMNNSISFGLEMVQRYAGDQIANEVNLIVMSVVVVLGLISIIWLAVKDKTFLRSAAPDPLLRTSSKIGALFSNPGGVAVLAFSLFTSIYILVKV